MANHLTPTELAREVGIERSDVVAKCVELGIPIFQGRVDKTLLLAGLKAAVPAHRQAATQSAAGAA